MDKIELNGWQDLFLFRYGTYWFIKAYIMLYIFAPVLNAFVELSSRLQIKYFLISFYIAQTVYGFYINIGWFSSGYSPLSFMGLYLLARYMRLYPNRLTSLNKLADISIYFIVSVIIALCSLLMTLRYGKVGTSLFSYSSPLMIISALYFFLFFTKLSIDSKIVNWISISCFAVYVVHCSPFLFEFYYVNAIRYWHENETIYIFLIHTSFLLVFYFLFSILLDKFRLIVWESFKSSLSRIRHIDNLK